MKKGNKWVGVLMGVIALIAVITIVIVFIVTRVQDKRVKVETSIEAIE